MLPNHHTAFADKLNALYLSNKVLITLEKILVARKKGDPRHELNLHRFTPENTPISRYPIGLF